MILRARQFTFTFPGPTLLMGIVNVTPDSFSDGGKFFRTEDAVARALELVADGADILDIGGESTRPNATPVSEAEELRRVIPVIEQLAPGLRIPISIDTQKPAVARAAVRAGASLINDIAANRSDDSMARLVAETGAAYVAMHMQGTPQTMQANPAYHDVVMEVADFFSDRLQRLALNGVPREQIILDVGMGFGKILEHNLTLLGALKSFTRFERPLLLGASRKSFLAQSTGSDRENRLPGGLACASWAVHNGVQIIRTHDVAETRQAVRMTEAIRAHQRDGQ